MSSQSPPVLRFCLVFSGETKLLVLPVLTRWKTRAKGTGLSKPLDRWSNRRKKKPNPVVTSPLSQFTYWLPSENTFKLLCMGDDSWLLASCQYEPGGSPQWRTQKIFMGVSFSGIRMVSFVLGARCLWRHNMTSHSCFPNQRFGEVCADQPQQTKSRQLFRIKWTTAEHSLNIRRGRKVAKVVRWFLDADDHPDSHQNLVITFWPIYNVPWNLHASSFRGIRIKSTN